MIAGVRPNGRLPCRAVGLVVRLHGLQASRSRMGRGLPGKE